MKKIIVASILISSALNASISQTINDFALQYGKQVACCVGAGLAIKWLRTPEDFKPTLNTIHAITVNPIAKSNTQTTIHDYMKALGNKQSEESQDVIISKTKNCIVHVCSGIDLSKTAAEQPVFVFSPLFMPKIIKHPALFSFFPPGAPGRALYAAGYYLANKTIPSNCVTFEYRDTRGSLNVAQELDQQCLSMTIKEVNRQDHGVVLFGICRGSTNILTFLTEQPKEYLKKNVKAAIMEAAPFTLKDICEQNARTLPVMKWLPQRACSAALYALFRFVLPNHHYQESQILQKVHNIPEDLPLLIIHVKNDYCVYDENIKALLQKLLETKHRNVHLLLFDNKELKHETICTAPVYPQATNAFLQKHGLPHDRALAREGQEVVPSILTPLACPEGTSLEKYIEELWTKRALNPDGTQTNAQAGKDD